MLDRHNGEAVAKAVAVRIVSACCSLLVAVWLVSSSVALSAATQPWAEPPIAELSLMEQSLAEQAEAQSPLIEQAVEELPLQVLRVGVENRSYWPRYGVSEAGQFSGYAQELLDAFAADSGYRLEYVLLEEEQLLQSLVSGEIDLRYPDSPSWAVAEKKGKTLHYSRALDFSVVGLNVAPERVGLHQFETLAMLQGFKAKEYQQQIKDGELIVYPTATLADLATVGGEQLVDGIYADPYVVRYHLGLQGYAGNVLEFDYSEPHTLHNYSLSTMTHPELMGEFDRWFKNHYDLVLKLRRAYRIYEF